MKYLPDFTVAMDEKPRILQITDTQTIDSAQCRTPDRLSPASMARWATDTDDENLFSFIREAVRRADPGLILLTGDVVYGEFDDSGRSLDVFCRRMDEFGIPWAPVFGNHDNESKKGVAWQCERLASSKFCLFKRGNVTGNGNYTVGLTFGGKLARVIYMMDSNGCRHATDPEVCRTPGFAEDQIDWLRASAERFAEENGGTPIPGFTAYHIASSPFRDAYLKAGYVKESPETETFVIGVTEEGKDGDFGFKYETTGDFPCPGLHELYRASGIDGVFVGHCHAIHTSVMYEGIRYTYGLKTGLYDYYVGGQIGTTLIDLSRPMPGSSFTVSSQHSLMRYPIK